MNNKRTYVFERINPRVAVFILMCADVMALLAAITISMLLRFEGMPVSDIYQRYIQPHLASLPWVILFYGGVFYLSRLYRYAWRYASLEMMWSVIYANTIGIIGLVSIQLLIDHSMFPRSVIIIFWISSIALIGGIRTVLRLLNMARRYGIASFRMTRNDIPPRRVVILGADETGARVLSALRESPSLNYQVIGILDDDDRKRGKYISNVKVIGRLDMLRQLIARREVDVVVVALPDTADARIRDLILECRTNKLPVKVVPQIKDFIVGNGSLKLVDFSVEDLLRHRPADTNVEKIGGYLKDRRVLVTGAGGSIGSELCRQIASLEPESLILLGHGEHSIHQIHQELLSSFPELTGRIHCVIGSVTDSSYIKHIFENHRPQAVFHAAAHKHVPLMETNELEAIHNNILGTYNIAEVCAHSGVERVVLISTDKAADPCCIMGATKWLCEEVFRVAAGMWLNTSFITVRFGNVLGSRGSVVPIFWQQILSGGPVTVTHPEMTRFFMTIPEAVRLVLQSGAVGESGRLYLLDMGDPVKIADLAEDMIRLCGLEPGRDIDIRYTGIRPGERLHERLISGEERIEKTCWDMLSIVRRPEYFKPSELLEILDRFRHSVSSGSVKEARMVLAEALGERCHLEDYEDDEDMENAEGKLSRYAVT